MELERLFLLGYVSIEAKEKTNSIIIHNTF
jgi:hypothetical protein